MSSRPRKYKTTTISRDKWRRERFLELQTRHRECRLEQLRKEAVEAMQAEAALEAEEQEIAADLSALGVLPPPFHTTNWRTPSRVPRVSQGPLTERAYRFAKQLTYPDFMVEVPSSLDEDWLVGIRPEGVRGMVVAFRGQACLFGKRGNVIHQFRTALPQGLCLLDVVVVEAVERELDMETDDVVVVQSTGCGTEEERVNSQANKDEAGEEKNDVSMDKKARKKKKKKVKRKRVVKDTEMESEDEVDEEERADEKEESVGKKEEERIMVAASPEATEEAGQKGKAPRYKSKFDFDAETVSKFPQRYRLVICDSLYWNEVETAGMPAHCRFFFLQSRFEECAKDLEVLSPLNQLKLQVLTYQPATADNILKVYYKQSVNYRSTDSLLFVHSEGQYTPGYSPLYLLWRDDKISKYPVDTPDGRSFEHQYVHCKMRRNGSLLTDDNIVVGHLRNHKFGDRFRSRKTKTLTVRIEIDGINIFRVGQPQTTRKKLLEDFSRKQEEAAPSQEEADTSDVEILDDDHSEPEFEAPSLLEEPATCDAGGELSEQSHWLINPQPVHAYNFYSTRRPDSLNRMVNQFLWRCRLMPHTLKPSLQEALKAVMTCDNPGQLPSSMQKLNIGAIQALMTLSIDTLIQCAATGEGTPSITPLVMELEGDADV